MASEPLTPDEEALNGLAEDVLKVARHLGPGYDLDPVAIGMACSFAALKQLYAVAHAAGKLDAFLATVGIMNETALKAAADMASGSETPNQRTQ